VGESNSPKDPGGQPFPYRTGGVSAAGKGHGFGTDLKIIKFGMVSFLSKIPFWNFGMVAKILPFFLVNLGLLEKISNLSIGREDCGFSGRKGPPRIFGNFLPRPLSIFFQHSLENLRPSRSVRLFYLCLFGFCLTVDWLFNLQATLFRLGKSLNLTI